MAKTFGCGALLPLGCVLALGCSSSGAAGPTESMQGTEGQTTTAGGNGSAGDMSAGGTGGGSATAGGSVGTAGDQQTVDEGGASGGSGGGAGVVSDAGGEASVDDGDTKPWRPLNVTVPPGQHTHMFAGSSNGLDNRAAKMMGKLIVDLGVSGGGYQQYLGKRGFHVFGVSFYHCDPIDNWAPPYGSDFDGDCRANTFDGMKHGNQSMIQPADSIAGKVKAGLASLQQQFPQEDWGYFLNQDGSVRWSDVGFTGLSHGAQTAARIAHLVRVYRAVSQSGPRDSTCGKGVAAGDFDPNNLPYYTDCTLASSTMMSPGTHHYATWQDEPSPTPIDRYYGFVGKTDVQYGDIMWSMDHMKFIGTPVNISKATAPYDGSHRFYAETGHSGFPDGFPMDAINIAFGVPPENQKPTF
jgi:hypothetical protein